MADEQAANATPAAEEPAVATPQKGTIVVPEGEVQVVNGPQAPAGEEGGDSYVSLFGVKAPTEAELRGEVAQDADSAGKPEETDTATPQPTGDGTKAGEQPPTGKEGEVKDGAADGTPEDGKPKGEDKKATGEEGKPPAGFVPIQALREEREKRQSLTQNLTGQLQEAQATINTLQAQLQTKPVITEAEKTLEKFKDFKVLTDEEYDVKVAEEGAEWGARYNKQLIEFNEAKRVVDNATAQQKQAAEREARQFSAAVSKSRAAIAEVVPGIYDRGENGEPSEVESRLAELAINAGVNENYLAAITDPETILLVKNHATGKYGPRHPAALGAASVLKALNTLLGQSRTTAAVTSEQEAQIRADEREKTTKELLGKIDKNTGQRSIGDIPAGRTDVEIQRGPISTEDWAKLPEEEQEKRLMGM